MEHSLSFVPIGRGTIDVATANKRESYLISFENPESFDQDFPRGEESYFAWVKEKDDEFPGACSLVYWDGLLAGQIELGVVKDSIFPTGYVYLFYVLPHLRRRGIGTLLNSYAITRFKEGNFRSIKLSVAPRNIAAIGFYLNQGWIPCGWRKGERELLVMEKQI